MIISCLEQAVGAPTCVNYPAAPYCIISTAGRTEQCIDTPSYRLFTDFAVKTNAVHDFHEIGIEFLPAI